MAANIGNVNSVIAEGYTGKKKSFSGNPWPDIYASFQDKYSIMDGIVSRIEEHCYHDRVMPCAVVMVEHVKGIIPLPESGCATKEKLRRLIGQVVSFRVTAVLETDNLFTASRKHALEMMARVTWERIREGDIRTAVVREVNFKNALVDIGGIQASLPVQEMSWGWVNDVREIMAVGDSFDVRVKSLNRDAGRVIVSLREAYPCPWPECIKRYSPGVESLGTVVGIQNYGIFVNLEPGVDMMVRQRRERIRPKMYEKVVVKIKEVDAQKNRLYGVIISRLGVR